MPQKMPPLLRCIVPYADVRVAPSETALLDTQILFGEVVDLLNTDGEYACVRAHRDGKEGWVYHLTNPFVPLHFSRQPTHRITATAALGYLEPDFKSPVVTAFPFNAKVAVSDSTLRNGQSYVRVSVPKGDVWVMVHQGAPLGDLDELASRDFVTEALKFLGNPYQWGGVAAMPGIDCSALIQQALLSCGIECPRDTGPQSEHVGKLICDRMNMRMLQRGDLVFWKGHVAVMTNSRMCVHSTARAPYAGVVRQEISEVLRERKETGEDKVIAVRRIPEYLHGVR